MIKLLRHLGLYCIMMKKVISAPEKWSVFRKHLVLEMEKVGLNSAGLVIILSCFIGAVVSIQTAINMTSAWLPSDLVGIASRDSLILEFAPTMISLILAGKVGSSIASEIGSMRVTEQIDALEIMGINSASFLILPKIIAAIFFFPVLIILSMSIGIIGAWAGGLSVDVISADFIFGLKREFIPFYITYAMIKTVFFAFIITSVSAYFGYHTKGGAIAVGKSSTTAVVASCILILVFNYLLTDILLS